MADILTASRKDGATMAGNTHRRQEHTDARLASVLARPITRGRSLALRGLPDEAERARRVPGIIFVDGPAGRRARIAGTGVDVFEVIRDYLEADKSRDILETTYDCLTPAQLDAALGYYAAYPEEIDARLALEAAFAEAFDHPRR
jgi:uncharacterized protein (DUF433 family)